MPAHADKFRIVAQARSFPLISESQVIQSLRLEPVFILLALALGSWVFYKLFLKGVSPERHRIFADNFRNLTHHGFIGLVFFGLYQALMLANFDAVWVEKLTIYVGLFAITWGGVIFVKTLRIIAYDYLFMTSMKAGVPLLLVNILTLAVSVILIAWALTTYFEIQLAPLLATSAVFSIVLGLALQDTLGNLFSAVALQLDKPFDLGDWIEVRNGNEKVAGQVREVSWRATVLLAITDELITLPNRHMAQSQILNFSDRDRGFVRSHIFRLAHNSPIDPARQVLLAAARATEGVLLDPPPVAIVTETTESWISLKLVYNIRDYGSQYSIADRFLSEALTQLNAAGIKIAVPRLSLDQTANSPSAS